MTRKDENILAWTLTILGLLGAGFAAGLHRLIWELFFFLTVLWWLLLLLSGEQVGYHVGLWILAIAPPIVIGIVVRIVERIAVTFFGAINESQSMDSKEIEK